jgi:nucleoside-diphosphate-sugar epimerase
VRSDTIEEDVVLSPSDRRANRIDAMKIVIPGGTGQVGALLARALRARGDDVVIVSRGSTGAGDVRVVEWDGRTPGAWAREVDGADAVVNLAGRSVNCRYSDANLEAMMSSRVDSTRAVGRAIELAARPLRVWLQMSTATIYAHRFDASNDEATGIIGGDEPGAPGYWKFNTAPHGANPGSQPKDDDRRLYDPA